MPMPDNSAVFQCLPILLRAYVDSRVVAMNSFGSEYTISRLSASRSTRLTQSNPARSSISTDDMKKVTHRNSFEVENSETASRESETNEVFTSSALAHQLGAAYPCRGGVRPSRVITAVQRNSNGQVTTARIESEHGVNCRSLL